MSYKDLVYRFFPVVDSLDTTGGWSVAFFINKDFFELLRLVIIRSMKIFCGLLDLVDAIIKSYTGS